MKLGLLTYAVDVAELAAQAEALGFDSFWVPEHTTTPVHIAPMHTTYRLHLEPDGTPQPMYRSGQLVDPFIALARASAVTPRCPPFWSFYLSISSHEDALHFLNATPWRYPRVGISCVITSSKTDWTAHFPLFPAFPL